MNKRLRGALIWFAIVFVIGLIFTKDIKSSFLTGILGVIIYFLIVSGVLTKVFQNIGGELKRTSQKIDAHDKKVASWKNKVYQERVLSANREMGRQQARRDFREREPIRKEQERRRKSFMNNPLGIGK